ncbi:MAG: hypothetical protein IJL79_03255 [Candidatus Methanomethylophilaceae archaeon]|nr:hypothetical protein [Candidatus Methanomethylophilaceae archaeon]
MCVTIENGNDNTEIRSMSRYLVIEAGDNGAYRVKGIRSDAPAQMIDEFIAWYRRNNRYENGRLRPEKIVRKHCVITV